MPVLLNASESGDPHIWFDVVHALHFDEAGVEYEGQFKADVTDLPGWRRYEDWQEQIIDLAENYVRLQPVDARWATEPGEITFQELFSYQALRLILKVLPERLQALPGEVWQRWAPVIVKRTDWFNDGGQYDHGHLMYLVYQHNPEVMVTYAEQHIQQCNQAGRTPSVYFYDLCWDLYRLHMDTRFTDMFWQFLKSGDFLPENVRLLLSFLLMRDVEEARTWALAELTRPLLEDETTRSRLVVIALALFLHTPDCGWGVIWPRMQRDEAFGGALISRLVAGEAGDVPGRGGRLSEVQRADLYIWLARTFPHREDPHVEGAHRFSDRERIAMWRNGLLRGLEVAGTPEALSAINHIVESLPELQWLRRVRTTAVERSLQQSWLPYPPSRVVAALRQVRLIPGTIIVKGDVGFLQVVTANNSSIGSIIGKQTNDQ